MLFHAPPILGCVVQFFALLTWISLIGQLVVCSFQDLAVIQIPSDDEVEDDSSSFVGEYAGDCGLLDLVIGGGSYIGGGEL